MITIAFLAGTSWLVAGLFALARFLEYRTGWLTLAAGGLWALAALQLSGSSALFTVGVAVGKLAFGPWIHLTMGFPEGRLRNRTDQALVTTTCVALLVFPAVSALFDPTPFSACEDCPEARMIADSPTIVSIAAALGALVGASLSVVFIVRLVRRYHAATPPSRRILGPVYAVSVGGLAAIIATNAAALVSAGAEMVAGVLTVWVRELYDRGMPTEEAVSAGIKSTAGVVSAAAFVMVAVFGIFVTLSTTDMKQLGFGLEVAILIDATIVWAVLLPATMKLLGKWNWYLPTWLEWLPRLEHERGPEPVPQQA